ncbi:hypothetical protein COLO4_36226 [Corchorus olitorius]|uniref:Uncharacterized protein n=1 Tax=Corchorus olitorius TaxID=93759 RepID=A0A1R3GAE4_9ROSI|nr:hypothetical protein COLO4_36226 [Corchorus olitorius]
MRVAKNERERENSVRILELLKRKGSAALDEWESWLLSWLFPLKNCPPLWSLGIACSVVFACNLINFILLCWLNLLASKAAYFLLKCLNL